MGKGLGDVHFVDKETETQREMSCPWRQHELRWHQDENQVHRLLPRALVIVPGHAGEGLSAESEEGSSAQGQERGGILEKSKSGFKQ